MRILLLCSARLWRATTPVSRTYGQDVLRIGAGELLPALARVIANAGSHVGKGTLRVLLEEDLAGDQSTGPEVLKGLVEDALVGVGKQDSDFNSWVLHGAPLV